MKKCLQQDELNNEIKIKQDMYTPPKIMGDQIVTSQNSKISININNQFESDKDFDGTYDQDQNLSCSS